jgi:hypothetical protein
MLDLCWLLPKDLSEQLLNEGMMIASQRSKKSIWVLAALPGQRGQMQRHDPSPRQLLQPGNLIKGERERQRTLKKARDLLGREAKISCIKFDEISAGTQLRQGQRRSGSAQSRDAGSAGDAPARKPSLHEWPDW